MYNPTLIAGEIVSLKQYNIYIYIYIYILLLLSTVDILAMFDQVFVFCLCLVSFVVNRMTIYAYTYAVNF